MNFTSQQRFSIYKYSSNLFNGSKPIEFITLAMTVYTLRHSENHNKKLSLTSTTMYGIRVFLASFQFINAMLSRLLPLNGKHPKAPHTPRPVQAGFANKCPNQISKILHQWHCIELGPRLGLFQQLAARDPPSLLHPTWWSETALPSH